MKIFERVERSGDMDPEIFKGIFTIAIPIDIQE